MLLAHTWKVSVSKTVHCAINGRTVTKIGDLTGLFMQAAICRSSKAVSSNWPGRASASWILAWEQQPTQVQTPWYSLAKGSAGNPTIV